MARDQVFTIAISGCSSAGKTTLAVLLSEIFSGVEVELNDTSSSTTNTKYPSNRIPIIHGDVHFSPKHLCPLTTFTSTPNDTAFCQESLKDDDIGQYFISWNGTRANDKSFTTPNPNAVEMGEEHRVPSNESVMTTFSVASTLHEGGRVKMFTVVGPDTDCDEALDFVGMWEGLKKGGFRGKGGIADIEDLAGELEKLRGENRGSAAFSTKDRDIQGVTKFKKQSDIEFTAKSLPKLDIENGGENGFMEEMEIKSDTDSDGGVPLSPHTPEFGIGGGVSLSLQTSNIEQNGNELSPKESNIQQNTATSLSPAKQDIEDLAPPFSHHGLFLPALRSQYSSLITEMRDQIKHFLTEIAKSRAPQSLVQIIDGIASFKPTLVIIESFLLFSDPRTVKASDLNPNTKRASEIITSLQERLRALSVKLEERGGVDSDLETERDYLEKTIWNINATCKKGMMEVFDVKLFLATSREVARKRRFERSVYMDRGDGGHGGRVPGQMWKTEGYFDGVAWGNYERLNGWLLDKGKGEGMVLGVHVRGEDWGVEETVRWAVGCVLEEMKILIGVEEKGTGQGNGQRKCSGCERDVCEEVEFF